MYIYHLPHIEKTDLCRILDLEGKWQELGAVHMKFDQFTIQEIQRKLYQHKSPSEELLKLWGEQNHSVLELFILLSRMKQYGAMRVIKRFVDPKYHPHIKDKEPKNVINANLENLHLNKDLGIPSVNIDPNGKILNVPYKLPVKNIDDLLKFDPGFKEINGNEVSVEDNESLNQRQRAAAKATRLNLGKNPLLNESAGSIPQISYEELQKATNNWSDNSVLGKGGFGTVFKGTWKCTQVAIKRIEQKENKPEAYNEQMKQSITELNCLNACRHDNILPLYGYSIGGPQPCLVYQYMPGGSLDYRLRTRDPSKILQWPKRLHIAVGTARGLQFLHTIGDKPLIHGDIKPANILLDANDNPRIGDFGLAKEGPQPHYTHITLSTIHGTRPYVPDEFLRAKKFSTKVDTYSFGVVLFELMTALAPYSDQRKEKMLKDHVVNYQGDIMELKDKKVDGGESVFKGLIDIGKLCVQKRAKDRPEMVFVLIELEKVSL